MTQGFSCSRQDLFVLVVWPFLNILMSYSLIQYVATKVPDVDVSSLVHHVSLFIVVMSTTFWGLTRLCYYSKILKGHDHSILYYMIVNLVLGITAIQISLGFIEPLPIKKAIPRLEIVSYVNVLLQVAIYSVIDYHWRFKQQSTRLELLLKSSELIMLRMQTNPHFLFNTLNLISKEIPERPELAQELIFDLSDLLRGTISLSNQKRIKVREEIELVIHYLTIQKARYGQRLETELHLDVFTQELYIPPMLILPLVENVIKHAVDRTHHTVTLNINTLYLNDGLIIQISNSWPEENQPTFTPGSGLKNIIDTLNLEYSHAYFEVGYQDEQSVATITINNDFRGNLTCIE